jgi:hypothetical protein
MPPFAYAIEKKILAMFLVYFALVMREIIYTRTKPHTQG